MHLREFESRINRDNFLKYRSQRLDQVVIAINHYLRSPSEMSLNDVEMALKRWRHTDPKEYRSRCDPIKHELDEAISLAGAPYWGIGPIRLVDRADHPTYDPRLWNGGAIQLSTNCYAYACNDPHGHVFNEKPQPGDYMRKFYPGALIGAHPPFNPHLDPLYGGPVTEKSIRLAVMQDDQLRKRNREPALIPRLDPYNNQDVVNIAGHYLIALVIQERTAANPNSDYHWYRQDNTGYWNHKPGNTEATDLDVSGNRIKDPRACNLGLYKFVMFYFAPRGGVRTASEGDVWHLPVRAVGGRRMSF